MPQYDSLIKWINSSTPAQLRYMVLALFAALLRGMEKMPNRPENAASMDSFFHGIAFSIFVKEIWTNQPNFDVWTSSSLDWESIQRTFEELTADF